VPKIVTFAHTSIDRCKQLAFKVFLVSDATAHGLSFYSSHPYKHAVRANGRSTHAMYVLTTSFPLSECGKAWQVRLQGWKQAKTGPEGHDSLHDTWCLPRTRGSTFTERLLRRKKEVPCVSCRQESACEKWWLKNSMHLWCGLSAETSGQVHVPVSLYYLG
jgi:hypothetical protein